MDKGKEYYLRRLRVIKILIAVLVISIIVLLTCTLWLVYLHVIMRSNIIDEYEVFSCLQKDRTCLRLMCPAGDEYDKEKKESCKVNS